ncbi:MAG: WecB/TagA/CpsF family glycosyltransferase [bacterium]|nr:WecB/TagA/CpsF family glycosyltransferase [bacterium]
MSLRKEQVLGIEVVTEDFNTIFRELVNAMGSGIENLPIVMACANPHALVSASELPEFYNALRSFQIIVPDGIGVVIASRLRRGEIRKRLPGPDFFENFCRYLEGAGISYNHFFLGSTEETLEKIVERFGKEFPRQKIAGTYSPPFVKGLYFGEEENRKILQAIESARPDIVWVGLTAPKQELWIYQNLDHLKKLSVKFAGAIGAAFDWFAGVKKRSPKIFRAIGLEWLPRLVLEPRRLWKRVFVSGPKFFYLYFREK